VSSGWYSILTPSERAGAIAMIQVGGVSADSLGLPRVAAGRVIHAELFGIDDGVILGHEDGSFVLMPHGGVAIVRSICQQLESKGVVREQVNDPRATYPEAATEIEAWCLYALSVAASDAAVDVLLDHNERWKALGVETCADGESYEGAHNGIVLDRLIHPPTVAAVGRANVGKSSLLNALVGQRVALVADVAGTTRDHVGVPVDLGGLVVRWIDTPGVDERIETCEEIMIAQRVVEHADVVVHCIDALGDVGTLDTRVADSVVEGTPVIRAGTRSDLGEHNPAVDVCVSVGKGGSGIGGLVSLIGERLVPGDILADLRPWRFWGRLRDEAERRR
jgi:tRNA modification GTPase